MKNTAAVFPTRFRPYELNQPFLLPPDLKEWLPEEDLVYFIQDVVEQLDLRPIYSKYDGRQGGRPPYDPRMMTGLLIYAYCRGMPSSRQIERATHEQVPYRVMTANEHPDHDTISNFRKEHLHELADLFVQVLRLCEKAGLVKLGHVALDGTKIKASASKHKAMSYQRMEKSAAALREEVEALLQEAEAKDAEEDRKYGKGRRGDELPEELRRKEARLAKIKAAMKELEAEAEAAAEAKRAEQREKEQKLSKEGRKRRGRAPAEPTGKPDPKAQRNFTDPESRIMKDGASKSFEQCYNGQAAVDEESQIILSAQITQQPNDKQQLKPLIEGLQENLREAGCSSHKPKKASADSGYYSEANVAYLEQEQIDGYLATERLKHGEEVPKVCGRIPKGAGVKERMRRKLRTMKGRATYRKRKAIVEPVFGQIKEARGFRRFSFRGLNNVAAEWDLVCLTHNLLKLYRHA